MAESSRLDELRRRVQHDPASIAFAALAEEYRRARRYRDAVDTSRAGLRHHPGYISARVTLGRSLIEMHDYEPAERELAVVLRSAPDNLAARRAMGELCWQQLRFADALHHYRTALALVPRDTDLPGIVDALEKELEAEAEAEAARAATESAEAIAAQPHDVAEDTSDLRAEASAIEDAPSDALQHDAAQVEALDCEALEGEASQEEAVALAVPSEAAQPVEEAPPVEEAQPAERETASATEQLATVELTDSAELADPVELQDSVESADAIESADAVEPADAAKLIDAVDVVNAVDAPEAADALDALDAADAASPVEAVAYAEAPELSATLTAAPFEMIEESASSSSLEESVEFTLADEAFVEDEIAPAAAAAVAVALVELRAEETESVVESALLASEAIDDVADGLADVVAAGAVVAPEAEVEPVGPAVAAASFEPVTVAEMAQVLVEVRGLVALERLHASLRHEQARREDARVPRRAMTA